jgi:hypothetical protein
MRVRISGRAGAETSFSFGVCWRELRSIDSISGVEAGFGEHENRMAD